MSATLKRMKRGIMSVITFDCVNRLSTLSTPYSLLPAMNSTVSTLAPTSAITHPERIYYYRPWKHRPGKLACAGYGAESVDHRAFYLPYFTNEAPSVDSDPRGNNLWRPADYLSGCVLVQGYHGQLIDRETAEQFAVKV